MRGEVDPENKGNNDASNIEVKLAIRSDLLKMIVEVLLGTHNA